RRFTLLLLLRRSGARRWRFPLLRGFSPGWRASLRLAVAAAASARLLSVRRLRQDNGGRLVDLRRTGEGG
ncbi:MAG: hypothetical protein K2X62_01595, partial [Beijerinckiaceae bacterium]|nr:hypothetical protein [Beijerinckiaceae bacterium]